jgi:hypothetical protein
MRESNEVFRKGLQSQEWKSAENHEAYAALPFRVRCVRGSMDPSPRPGRLVVVQVVTFVFADAKLCDILGSFDVGLRLQRKALFAGWS